MRYHATGSAAHGFTLIELMIVVLVLAIMIVMGAPAFRDIVLSQRVKSASFDVFSSLVMARSEAITRNTTVTVAPISGDWANGWTVTESGGVVVRQQDAYTNVNISLADAGSFVPAGTISFNGMGRLTVAAQPKFTLDATAPNVIVAMNKRCIIIDASGRPVTKPPEDPFTCP